MVVAEVILPVFFVVFLGFLLKRFSEIDERVFSRVQLYILSPALVFMAMTRAEAGTILVLKVLLFVSVMAVIILAAAQLMSVVTGRSREERFAISMAAVLMNAGFYGIPVCMLAFGEKGLIYASIFVVASATVQATLGVYLANAGSREIKDAVLTILKVPLIHAIVLARILVHFNALPPEPLLKMVDMLGNAAIPLGLLLLGMQLVKIIYSGRYFPAPSMAARAPVTDGGDVSGFGEVEQGEGRVESSAQEEIEGISDERSGKGARSFGDSGGRSEILSGMAAGAARIGLGFLVAILLLRFFDFKPGLEKVIIVESSMPTAVNAVVYATEFNSKPKLVAMAILFSTLISIVTVYLVITYAV